MSVPDLAPDDDDDEFTHADTHSVFYMDRFVFMKA